MTLNIAPDLMDLAPAISRADSGPENTAIDNDWTFDSLDNFPKRDFRGRTRQGESSARSS